MMGVAGAGKTSVGERLSAGRRLPFLEGDTLHPAANVAKISAGTPLTDADRWPWLDAIGAWLDSQAAAGAGGVATYSALKRSYRERLLAARPGVRLVHLHGAPGLIAQRQAERPGHFMPPSLMASQFATLEAPGPEEAAILLSVDAAPEAVLRAALAGLGRAVSGG
jgi:gluconokinase